VVSLTETLPHSAPSTHLESPLMTRDRVKTSKFLSLVLRHRPEAIGLALDGGGWASVAELIEKAGIHGRRLDLDLIADVVAHNDKKRFSLSPNGERIRANQGHSFPVDLGLEPVEPPAVLFHGTARRFLDSILASGLEPRGRQHVHLSADRETATKVGQRHGKPVVLEVDAAAMAELGHTFYLSANGVWLTESVPARFLLPNNQ